MDVIAAYETDQRRRGLLPGTRKRRGIYLRAFARWLGRDPLTATPEEIESFLDSRRLTVAQSRYTWCSTLSCFYAFAVKAGLTDVDPTIGIERPKLRRRLPRPMDVADFELAVAGATPMMRAWLYLDGYAGLRVGEMSRLERHDVLDGADPPLLRVLGKGDTERVVGLHEEVRRALRLLPMPARGPLFVSERTGVPLNASQVSKRINGYLRRLGITAVAHQGRHMFATSLLRSCGNLRVVQESLGHADVSSTAIYTKVTAEEAAGAVRSLSLT